METFSWHIPFRQGLDYPGVGPEHAYLRDSGRAQYVSITDKEAMDALMDYANWKESFRPSKVHMPWHMPLKGKRMRPEQSMIVCLSGRGDKMSIRLRTIWQGKVI